MLIALVLVYLAGCLWAWGAFTANTDDEFRSRIQFTLDFLQTGLHPRNHAFKTDHALALTMLPKPRWPDFIMRVFVAAWPLGWLAVAGLCWCDRSLGWQWRFQAYQDAATRLQLQQAVRSGSMHARFALAAHDRRVARRWPQRVGEALQSLFIKGFERG